jgi:hypothetical protein
MMTLFPMDGIVFEVRNQKERCRAWSPIAMTSHVWTVSMLLFKDSTDMSITLFVQTPVMRQSNVAMSSTLN